MRPIRAKAAKGDPTSVGPHAKPLQESLAFLISRASASNPHACLRMSATAKVSLRAVTHPELRFDSARDAEQIALARAVGLG